MKKKLNSIQADLILVTVAIIWGSIFPVTKDTLNQVGPFAIITFRFLLAFLILAVIFRKRFKSIRLEDVKGGVIVGASLFGALFTQLIGLMYTSAGKQSFLIATYVVMVPFMYWVIHKKRPELRMFVAAAICFIGFSILTLNGGFSITFGDSITLLSSVLYGVNLIATGHFVRKQDTGVFMVLQFGVAGGLSLLAMLIFEPQHPAITMNAWGSLFYLSIVCTLIAYYLQAIGQKYTPSTHASIILSTESVFGSILSVIMLHEVFTMKMIVSFAAIFISILIIEYSPSAKESEVISDCVDGEVVNFD